MAVSFPSSLIFFISYLFIFFIIYIFSFATPSIAFFLILAYFKYSLFVSYLKLTIFFPLTLFSLLPFYLNCYLIPLLYIYTLYPSLYVLPPSLHSILFLPFFLYYHSVFLPRNTASGTLFLQPIYLPVLFHSSKTYSSSLPLIRLASKYPYSQRQFPISPHILFLCPRPLPVVILLSPLPCPSINNLGGPFRVPRGAHAPSRSYKEVPRTRRYKDDSR